MIDQDDSISVPVPLPTEVPPPPNFSQLPAHILHSGTVETLIGQNEDLMARLKVNLRRNGMLEQRLIQQDEMIQEITALNNSLVAQLQVMQEKERLTREKNADFDRREDEMLGEIQLLKAKLEAAEERRDELNAGLEFESSYRRRIRKWVRPLLTHLRERVTFLDSQLASREVALSDIRTRLNDTITHMQTLARTHASDQAQLVDQYEARIETIQIELTKARGELKHLRDKSERLDEAVAAKANFENRVIFLERKLREVEQSLGGELKDFQMQTATYRREAKDVAAQLFSAQADIREISQQRDDLKGEHSRLQDQFESLQTVWVEAQKKVEAMKLQQDALNKLNQELSRQLKEERKRKADTQRIATPQAPTTAAAMAAPTIDKTNERLEKIDTLLAALESGMMGSLDIIDEEAPPEIKDKSSESPEPIV